MTLAEAVLRRWGDHIKPLVEQTRQDGRERGILLGSDGGASSVVLGDTARIPLVMREGLRYDGNVVGFVHTHPTSYRAILDDLRAQNYHGPVDEAVVRVGNLFTVEDLIVAEQFGLPFEGVANAGSGELVCLPRPKLTSPAETANAALRGPPTSERLQTILAAIETWMASAGGSVARLV